jgi:hypothetical protein
MWSTVIVKAQVAFQRGLQEPDVREEPAAELDAPELAEDGALQPFRAVRPSPGRFAIRSRFTR